MPNQNNIDNASEQIALLVEQARNDIIDTLADLKRSHTMGAFLEILLELDIENSLKNKLIKATQIYANAHRGVLQTTTMFGDPDGNLLVSFANLNEELFDSAIVRTISGHI